MHNIYQRRTVWLNERQANLDLINTVETVPEPPAASPRKEWGPTLLRGLDALTGARAALVSFGAVLLVSFAVLYVVRPVLGITRPLGGEGYDGYLELAQNLARGNGYVFEPGGHSVFHRPPLYPLLLTPGMYLPESLWRLYVIVLNGVIFAAAGVVLLQLGKIMFGQRTAAVAWLLFTFNPFVIWTVKNAVPPVCQTFAYLLLLLMTWNYFWLINARERIPKSLLAGFLGAAWLAVMSHGTMLAVVVSILALLALAAAFHRLWSAAGALVVILFGLALAIAPWTFRNYKVTGMFIPITGNSGLAYFAGNAHWGITQPACLPTEQRHEAELRHIGLPPEKVKELVSFYGFTNPEAEKLANSRFKQHLRKHPIDFAKKIALNGLEYYWPIIFHLYPPRGTYLHSLPLSSRLASGFRDILPQTIYNLVLVALSVAGLCWLFRNGPLRFHAAFLLVAWAAFALPYFPFLTFFAGRSYYTFGTYPVLALLAAALLVRPQPACINLNHGPQ